jgi:hypothetical protein
MACALTTYDVSRALLRRMATWQAPRDATPPQQPRPVAVSSPKLARILLD